MTTVKGYSVGVSYNSTGQITDTSVRIDDDEPLPFPEGETRGSQWFRGAMDVANNTWLFGVVPFVLSPVIATIGSIIGGEAEANAKVEAANAARRQAAQADLESIKAEAAKGWIR